MIIPIFALQLHHVFDEITVMKHYEGLVLLLEEDYYVAPDTIIVLQMMQNLQKRSASRLIFLDIGFKMVIILNLHRNIAKN